jgi:hypothetical protein
LKRAHLALQEELKETKDHLAVFNTCTEVDTALTDNYQRLYREWSSNRRLELEANSLGLIENMEKGMFYALDIMYALILHIACAVVTTLQRSGAVKAAAKVFFNDRFTHRRLHGAIESWRLVRNHAMHEYKGYSHYVSELDRLRRTWSIILETVEAVRKDMGVDFAKQVLHFYRERNN